MALLCELLEDCLYASFVSLVEVVGIVVELEVGIVLVDGVVGEMHAHVVEVCGVGGLVGVCGEPDKSFLVDEDAQGMRGGEEDVESDVELEAVNEEGAMEIALCDVVVGGLDVVE